MSGQLRFCVLGPLMVTAGESAVPLGGSRQRTILALLLVAPGRVVPVDAMVESVWNSNPPSTVRTQVAICVAALRKTFRGAGASGDVIVTAHPGYAINIEDHQLDTAEFTELVQSAEECARQGRSADAAHRYQQALDLWRGPAFAGVTGQLVEDEAARLEEHRLNVHDDSVLARLDAGQHQELIPTLATMVREHPLRERTRHHLMLAQYRSGRRADALETYREAYELFNDELGIEPGPDLKDLHEAILRDDPSLTPEVAAAHHTSAPVRTPAPAVAVPCELPPDVPAFSGRSLELAALDDLITGQERDGACTVGLITGAAGIGKSGLAIRWAFRAAEHFPDGQLFVDVHGYDEHHESVSAHAVLNRFLRSLGVPGEHIPAPLEERVSLYRSLLADRRVLIVLDNARTYAQIRPLLPGSGRCRVLVTSRDQMKDLVTWPPQARVHLNRLSEPDAVELITKIVGESRVRPARADAARLAELCDWLPLALRIAAARLASKPHWTVHHLVTRLSDERHRLDELSQGESGLRADLALSYQYLSEPACRLLRRLGLLDVPDFAAWAGAALLDKDVLDAERLIEDLVDAQFIEVVNVDATGQLRYRLHSLVRLYARERAGQEEPEQDRLDACARFLSAFVTIAEEADRREDAGGGTGIHSGTARRRIDPGYLDRLLAVPLEWYEAERLALVASVRQAARLGLAELAWDLTVCAFIFFGIRSYTEDWRLCCEEALEAARSAGDLRGQGAMLYGLGALDLSHSKVADAVAYFEEALEYYAGAGEDRGRAMALRSMGQADRMRGDLDLAMTRFAQALPIFREVGDRYCEAHTLSNMAETELDAGRPEVAMQYALGAVRLEDERGVDTRNLAQALYRLGRVHGALGQLDAAEESFLRAVRIVKKKADTIGLAHTLLGLGEIRLSRGDPELAAATLTEALKVAEESGSPMVAGRVDLALGEVSLCLGRLEAAQAHVQAARKRFGAVGVSVWERRAEQALTAMVG